MSWLLSHIAFRRPRSSANEIAGGGPTSLAWNSSCVPLAKVMDRVLHVICLLLEVPLDVLAAARDRVDSELRFAGVNTG